MNLSPGVLAFVTYFINIPYLLIPSIIYIFSILMMRDIDKTRNFAGTLWLIFFIQHISYCFFIYALVQKGLWLIVLSIILVYSITLASITLVLKKKLKFSVRSIVISCSIFTFTYLSPYIFLYILYVVKK